MSGFSLILILKMILKSPQELADKRD